MDGESLKHDHHGLPITDGLSRQVCRQQACEAEEGRQQYQPCRDWTSQGSAAREGAQEEQTQALLSFSVYGEGEVNMFHSAGNTRTYPPLVLLVDYLLRMCIS